MAVTITQSDATVAIRAAADAEAIPGPIAATVAFLFPAAVAIILEYAPKAPNDVHNAALIRLLGWLYDADPADPALGRALSVSGAAALLSQWRIHRAGAITATDTGGDTPTPTPPEPEPPVPEPPFSGSYVLTSVNGSLQWIAFPQPQ